MSLSYLNQFIEEEVIPNRDKFPIPYDLNNVLVKEALVEILSNEGIYKKVKNVRPVYNATIMDFIVNIEGEDRVLSIFHEHKILEFDVLYEGEYLTLLEMDPQSETFEDINSLVKDIMDKLW